MKYELQILTQMIRTHRGTRRREADTSGSSPILLPHTPSTLLIQVGPTTTSPTSEWSDG